MAASAAPAAHGSSSSPWTTDIPSPQIRQLCIQVCGELGIRTTQSNPRSISVAHRDSVAIMERIVGPKF
jgi:hypothetical protein